MQQRLIILIFSLLINQSIKAQSLTNFDFEDFYPQTEIVKSWKTGVDNGIYKSDNTVSFSGKRSFKITSPSSNYPKTAYVEISNLLNRHLHTTIRIEAMILFDTTQLVKPDLSIDLKINDRDTTVISKILDVNGKSNWKKTILSFKISEKQNNTYLSIRNNAKGEVWFDNIKIFSDGKEVNYRDEKVQIRIQKSLIHQISKTEDSHFIFPASFDRMISEKRIIAIGEGTHGSMEFRLLQQSIIKQLSTTKKDLLIAIEASASDCYRLNDYIIKGSGNPNEILKQMNTNHFKYFCTEDFLNFIEWLKLENKNRENKIKIYGVDVQFNNNAAENIFREDKSNSLIDTIVNICRRNRYLYPNQNNSNDLKLLDKTLTILLSNLNEHKSTRFDDYYIIQALRLQMIGQRTYLQNRDSLMAENIKILNQQNPQAKIVFLAHNIHCSSEDNYNGYGIKMTGYFLKKIFDDDYLSIGTLANQGYYTSQDFAVEPKVMDNNGFYTSTDFTSKNVTSNNTLHLAPTGSIEHYLSKHNKAYLLVEMPENTNSKMLIRDIGLVKRDCEQFNKSKSSIYDYIIYFDTVSSTKIISY